MKIQSLIPAGALLLSVHVFASPVKVKLDPTPKQTLVSFGASGAWWPNDLIRFPKAVQQELGKFLFSSDGMYLSSYRYNMGGGGGNDTQEVTAIGSRVQSFLLSNGTYDWSRDPGGRLFMAMAQNYSVPEITFFINAAPAAIATNGAACGWNMTHNKIKPFATYIKKVLSHWIDQGIDIKYISTMNEPDNDRSDCSQEGMAVQPSLRAPVVKAVRQALDKGSSKSVQIIADETSQVGTQALPEDPFWLAAAAPYMSNIAIHNYDFPNDTTLIDYNSSIHRLTKGETFPPVKFTETCCSTNAGTGSTVFGAQYDPSMSNALIVARYVWQFLTLVNAVSFDWWTAVTDLPCSPTIDGEQCATSVNYTAGYNSGLVYIDPNYNQTHDFRLFYTKRAFMQKHFAYFHRPGSVRYDVPQTQLPTTLNAIASKSETGSVWSVLLMNHAKKPEMIDLFAPHSGAKLTRVVKTTNHTDFDDVRPLPKMKKGSVAFKLPAQSMVTFQFTG